VLGMFFGVLVVPASAASILVAENAHDEALRVDLAGNAEVSWIASDGERHSLVVARSGALQIGGRLVGADASRAIATVAVPLLQTIRQGRDGTFYALQAWQRLPGAPVELRFSRWRGLPTQLTLQAICCKWGSENIQGTATFHGRAIFGNHSTPKGVPLDPFGRNVYLDSYRGDRWQRMMGILTHRPTGFFSLWIRHFWLGSQYRGTMIGPNWGWTLAPDAEAEARSSRR
jgi:hypothetical protein